MQRRLVFFGLRRVSSLGRAESVVNMVLSEGLESFLSTLRDWELMGVFGAGQVPSRSLAVNTFCLLP